MDELMYDALILAKQLDFDVFNALDLMVIWVRFGVSVRDDFCTLDLHRFDLYLFVRTTPTPSRNRTPTLMQI